ncbi:MAG: M50 family metallopeptidase [Patescibacteria group bacterium]
MTVLIFLIVLSVIIFVHELGHFVMAKRAGMKVEEFGFGFPPRLWGYKPKDSETTYTINAIPFGGFVKILGEDGESKDNRSFTAKKFWPRVSVIIAGVVMNFLLAAVLFSIVNGIGSEAKILITAVAKDSPAYTAGIRMGDELIGFESIDAVQYYIAQHKGEEITLQLSRGSVKLTPRENPPPGEGAIGIAFTKTEAVSYSWYESIVFGFRDAAVGVWMILKGFGTIIKNLFITGKAGVELAGPVGIAIISGQAARLGLVYLLQFVAVISLNLAVINIVPFPALDGGRLLFLIIEKIKGSPLPKRLENGFNTVGFIFLLLLMFYITTKDVLKFF